MCGIIRSVRSARRTFAALTLLAAGAAGLAGTSTGAMAAGRPATVPAATARTWANLILNLGAQAGAASVQGWDSVTIPGWQIERGLPTVVRYGTRGFPAVTGRGPAVRGGQLLVGGVGGTALLGQDITLRAPDGQAPGSGTRFELSGWLGGSRASRASLTVRFLSAAGRVLGRSSLGPVGRVSTRIHPGLVFRSHGAVLPRGTVRARLTLRLASSLKGADGPHGPLTGYNRAIADGLRFAVGAPVKPAVLRPPAALAVTPDGRTLYVANSGSGTVTPVSTRTGRAGPPIAVGRYPRAIAMSRNDRTAYVLDWGSGQVTPVDLRTGRAGRAIRVGAYPVAAAFSPGGGSLYVASYGADTVTPVDLRTGRAGRPVRVGYSPAAIALSASGTRLYVVGTISGTVTPIGAASGHRGRAIPVGSYSYPTAIGMDPAGPMAVVLGTYAGTVRLIDTRTDRASRAVRVGSGPVAVAFGG